MSYVNMDIEMRLDNYAEARTDDGQLIYYNNPGFFVLLKGTS
jgi:hypothetical protein